MNWNVCLGVLLALLIYPTYRNIARFLPASAAAQGIIVFDKEKTVIRGEILINDFDLKDANGFSITGEGMQRDSTQRLEDGSQIKTSYDAFGNKTETRVFFNNPRLKQIVLRTSVDGQKQIYVYGQNGEVESVPESRLTEVLNSSANEIAGFAGITSVKGTKRMRSMFPQTNLLASQQTYQNPVQTQQPAIITPPQETETVPTETNEKPPIEPNKNPTSQQPSKQESISQLPTFIPKRKKP